MRVTATNSGDVERAFEDEDASGECEIVGGNSFLEDEDGPRRKGRGQERGQR